MRTIAAVKGIDRLGDDDLRRMLSAAEEIGTDVDYLAAVISFESAGTFSPSIKNRAGSGAVGLIQFTADTARALGVNTDLLAGMSFDEQMGYVVHYFKWFEQKGLNTLHKLYLAVFYPAAIERDDTWVIAGKDGPHPLVYVQNRWFDSEGKGYVTRGDVCKTIDKVLEYADTQPRIDVCTEEGENNA